MTNEAIIEQVARAIIACRHADDDAPSDDIPTTDYDRDMARAAIAAMGERDADLEALRELSAAYAGGDIVGFRARFRTQDDQDQTLTNAAGEELATTYNEDTARFIAAAVNYVRAKLSPASKG